tara:strand:+ start:2286 stop:2555 length:270 start_codon:yes stop_codon:yes gene_type:complete
LQQRLVAQQLATHAFGQSGSDLGGLFVLVPLPRNFGTPRLAFRVNMSTLLAIQCSSSTTLRGGYINSWRSAVVFDTMLAFVESNLAKTP